MLYRTSKEWDNVLERWKDKQPTLLPCLEDLRQQEQVTVELSERSARDSRLHNACKDLFILSKEHV